MMRVFVIIGAILLTGCQWSYGEVQTAIMNCQSKGGQPDIRRLSGNTPIGVTCVVDGIRYPMNRAGGM